MNNDARARGAWAWSRPARRCRASLARSSHRLALIVSTLLAVAPVRTATSAPLDSPNPDARIVCQAHSCLVASEAAFPSLVIGEVTRVDDVSQARSWWSAVRAQGAWAALPEDANAFARLVRPVTIRTADRANPRAPTLALTVLMTQFELDSEAMPPGTLVRYLPHGAGHERPPKEIPELAPWWDITGCVLVICLAADAACKERYLPGVYERDTGRGVDWRSGVPTTTAPLIDARTQMRVSAPTAAGPT
jgi:hypothetical protein